MAPSRDLSAVPSSSISATSSARWSGSTLADERIGDLAGRRWRPRRGRRSRRSGRRRRAARRPRSTRSSGRTARRRCRSPRPRARGRPGRSAGRGSRAPRAPGSAATVRSPAVLGFAHRITSSGFVPSPAARALLRLRTASVRWLRKSSSARAGSPSTIAASSSVCSSATSRGALVVRPQLDHAELDLRLDAAVGAARAAGCRRRR